MPAQLGVRRDAIMPQTRMTGGDGPEGHDAVRRLEELVDETLKASFPASDPPAWTLGGSRHYADRPEDTRK